MTKPIPFPKKGDECFSFLVLEWNITYALTEIIMDRPPNSRVRVASLVSGMTRIDEAYALNDPGVDLSKPVIIGQLGGKLGSICLDGSHRGFKARAVGYEHLLAHTLTEAETLECCYTRKELRRARKISER